MQHEIIPPSDTLSATEVPPGPEQGKWFSQKILSLLPRGSIPQRESPPELRICVDREGFARRVNFWDIDKTLLHAYSIHEKVFESMFQNVPTQSYILNGKPATLFEVFVAGWQLGNSFREWDRMCRIIFDGQTRYIDPDIYNREIMGDRELLRKIQDPILNDPLHQRAARYLAQCDEEGGKVIARMEEISPGVFKNTSLRMKSTMHLIEAKARLGEINVFMTANPPQLAEGLVRVSGLSRFGFALAGDREFTGGGKELAIQFLIDKVEEVTLPNGKLLKVHPERVAIYGDSFAGDLGSALRYSHAHPEFKFDGVLLRNDLSEIREFESRLATAQGAERIQNEAIIGALSHFTIIADTDVLENTRGMPLLGRRGKYPLSEALRNALENES